MRQLRFSIIGALLITMTGCDEKVAANVDCVTTAAPAVECDVSQTLGKSEIEVCWDFAVTCANGSEVKAERTCQKVADAGTVKAVIPANKLTGIDQCGGEGPPVGKISGLTINGKPPE